MDIFATGNASPLEMVYTSIVAITFCLVAWTFVDSLVDWRGVIRDRLPRAYRIEASSAVRAEAVRMGVVGLFVSLGVQSILQPPPHDTGLQTFELINSIFFIGIAAVLGVDALLARLDRRELREEVRHLVFARKYKNEKPSKDELAREERYLAKHANDDAD
jgi:hypothetical protein